VSNFLKNIIRRGAGVAAESASVSLNAAFVAQQGFAPDAVAESLTEADATDFAHDSSADAFDTSATPARDARSLLSEKAQAPQTPRPSVGPSDAASVFASRTAESERPQGPAQADINRADSVRNEVNGRRVETPEPGAFSASAVAPSPTHEGPATRATLSNSSASLDADARLSPASSNATRDAGALASKEAADDLARALSLVAKSLNERDGETLVAPRVGNSETASHLLAQGAQPRDAASSASLESRAVALQPRETNDSGVAFGWKEAAESESAAPRVHVRIGSVEVRMSAPPAPRAPRATQRERGFEKFSRARTYTDRKWY